MQSPIFGSFYVSRSQNLAAEQCVNLYPEVVETKSGKQVGALYGCPGLTLYGTYGGGPIRGMHVANGVLYVVSGSGVYTAPAGTLIGTIAGGSSPVEAIDNGADGNQVLFTAGQAAWVVQNATVTPVTLPFVGAGANDMMPAYCDGFGFLTQPGSNIFWQSNLLDLSTWDALSFASASGDPDNNIAMAQVRRQLFIIKENHAECWVDAGNGGFSFARLDGVHLEVGCVAPHSVTNAGEQIVWLSQNGDGEAVVIRLEGYTPRSISTSAIEDKIQSYATLSDAIGYSYQRRGHLFYVLTFPSANATWVLDLTTSDLLKTPMWHQRAAFSNGMFSRHQGNAHAFYGGLQLVGDYQNGNVYVLDENALTDNGAARKWLRSWRALQKPSEEPIRFSNLRIDMQTGINVPDGTNPQCMLCWSDDGGHNWSSPRIEAVGPPGKTAQRVQFKRLGSTRRNSGLDRIFELSSADQFPPAIIGADLT